MRTFLGDRCRGSWDAYPGVCFPWENILSSTPFQGWRPQRLGITLFLSLSLSLSFVILSHTEINSEHWWMLQLRVSSMISNSPYILVLDCDMYCNDPASVRQAMCCHLDPKLSPSLAFVQFPQRFHNISSNDIYDSQMRSAFSVC